MEELRNIFNWLHLISFLLALSEQEREPMYTKAAELYHPLKCNFEKTSKFHLYTKQFECKCTAKNAGGDYPAEYSDMSAISLWYSEILNQFMFYISSGVLKFEIVWVEFQPIQMTKDSGRK